VPVHIPIFFWFYPFIIRKFFLIEIDIRVFAFGKQYPAVDTYLVFYFYPDNIFELVDFDFDTGFFL